MSTKRSRTLTLLLIMGTAVGTAMGAAPLVSASESGKSPSPAPATIAEPQGPYSGQELRTIKALSEDDVRAYLEGQGMGFAKAAELNRYPGPKHVLELMDALALSVEQGAAVKRSFDAMKATAVTLGRAIVEKETALDGLFARGEIDAKTLQAAVGEIARLQGELRAAHLAAHLETRELLSPQQIARYDELRGYGTNAHAGHGQHRD